MNWRVRFITSAPPGVEQPRRIDPRNTRAATADSRAAVTTALPLLGVAAAAAIVAVRQMSAMDMGTATELGSFTFFVGVWVAMMVAMMLPGAIPAALRVQSSRPLQSVPLFAGSYLVVWILAGLVAFVLYRPHGTTAAGVLTAAAGLYEFTPVKRACRRRCRERVHSGLRFGLYCVGSSIGLMAMLLAVDAMSVTWMCVVAAVVLTQKLLPLRAVIDVPVALAIIGFGVTLAVFPTCTPFT
jgi:predicted metal-binding membrane protein